MTDAQTCKSCGETKPLANYERLSSGGHRGTCTDCRRIYQAASKQRRKEARESTPEFIARVDGMRREKGERDAKRLAERVTPAERAALRDAKREEAAMQAMIAKQEQEAALRDDIWSGMWTGRSRRALSAIQPQRAKGHRLKLRDGSGYISIAEIACRVAERNAVHRAAKACKTHGEAQAAIKVLERDTQGRERSGEMRALAQSASGHRSGLAGPGEGLEYTAQDDPFGDAFGTGHRLGCWPGPRRPEWLERVVSGTGAFVRTRAKADAHAKPWHLADATAPDPTLYSTSM